MSNSDWRLAFMADARDGNLAALEERLHCEAATISRSVGSAHLRMGVADTHPDVQFMREAQEGTRTVDAVIEISVTTSRVIELPAIAESLVGSLGELGLAAIEVMAGPVFPMVPVRSGGVFLSLAFKRYPGTTSDEFRHWWLRQHSVVAIPVMESQLLAYDQVHVDARASAGTASAVGTRHVEYDAYDNLTWADRESFLASISRDPAGMADVVADEAGRIDNTSRRRALMRLIGD